MGTKGLHFVGLVEATRVRKTTGTRDLTQNDEECAEEIGAAAGSGTKPGKVAAAFRTKPQNT